VNVRKDLDLRVWAEDVSFEDAIGPHYGYRPNDAAVVREKILRRVGEAPVVFLGAGSMGVAYGLPSGKVLKLTRDPSEVGALSVMRGAQHPNLIQVFDAFYAVNDPTHPMPMGVGVVVRESIDSTARQVPAFDKLARLFGWASVSGASAGDFCKGMDAYVARLDAVAHGLNTIERVFVEGVLAAVAKLRELGICTYDLSQDNIGIIAGRPVLYDVGAASVTGADPDVI